MKNCFFCDTNDYILENDLAKGRYDTYAVSKGHMNFVTKRCVETFFDTTDEEKIAIFDLINKAKEMLDEKYHPDGYNIGMNCKEAAGQSVMHVHVHLIPRYKGDVENPRGGVRGVIPSKQNYVVEK